MSETAKLQNIDQRAYMLKAAYATVEQPNPLQWGTARSYYRGAQRLVVSSE